ncbi:hypothetical protein Vretifemale_3997 [Volvox reticuliferus]|nr:hypothetical protein Vretifemale_3997 [Volvox reticuliferus]
MIQLTCRLPHFSFHRLSLCYLTHHPTHTGGPSLMDPGVGLPTVISPQQKWQSDADASPVAKAMVYSIVVSFGLSFTVVVRLRHSTYIRLAPEGEDESYEARVYDLMQSFMPASNAPLHDWDNVPHPMHFVSRPYGMSRPQRDMRALSHAHRGTPVSDALDVLVYRVASQAGSRRDLYDLLFKVLPCACCSSQMSCTMLLFSIDMMPTEQSITAFIRRFQHLSDASIVIFIGSIVAMVVGCIASIYSNYGWRPFVILTTFFSLLLAFLGFAFLFIHTCNAFTILEYRRYGRSADTVPEQQSPAVHPELPLPSTSPPTQSQSQSQQQPPPSAIRGAVSMRGPQPSDSDEEGQRDGPYPAPVQVMQEGAGVLAARSGMRLMR